MTKSTALVLCLIGLAVVFGLALMPQASGQPNVAGSRSSSVIITESGKTYVFGGYAPSVQLKQGLLKAASQAYSGAVTDTVSVDSSASPEQWWSNPVDLLPPSAQDIANGKIEIEGEHAELHGTMTSLQKHQGYLARLKEADPNLQVQDDINISVSAADAPQALQADLDRTVLNHTIEFETNSDVLSTDGVKLCQVIAEKLINMPSINVEVQGYTDNVGQPAANLDLSQRRAEAVCNYLSEHGVERSRLTAQGYGETGPVAGNDTDEGRYKNRRIAFKVTGG